MTNAELVAVKHGSSTSENHNGIGLSQASTNYHMTQHHVLWGEGYQTFEIASGLVVAGKEGVQEDGLLIEDFDDTELAIRGIPKQISSWEQAGMKWGVETELLLTTDQHLRDGTLSQPIVEQIKKAAAIRKLLILNEHPVKSSYEMHEFEAGLEAKQAGEDDPETDNDLMAVLAAIATNAGTLLLLTNKDGVEANGGVLNTIDVDQIPEIKRKFCGGKSASGTGGMARKLDMAAVAASAGMNVYIGNAFTNVRHILSGEAGTRVVQ